MASWGSKTAIAAADIDPSDVLPLLDLSAAAGSRDRVATIAALSQALGGNQVLFVSQTTHGFSVGDVLRHNGTSWVEATADTTGNAVFGGIITSVPDVDSFLLTLTGYVTGLSGLTAGSVHYLQDAGGLGTTAATVTVPVLLAVTTTAGVLLNMAASGAVAWGGIGGTLADQTDLQAAIDAKLAKLATINSFAGNHTLDASDSGAYVRITAAGTVTLPDGLSTGFQCVIVNATDADTVALSAATTLVIPSGFNAEIVNRRAITAIHVGSNVWEAHGALVETP